METISAVVPTYNSRETLGSALQSIAQQTVPIAETIVVDDGSSDGTAEWVQEAFGWVRLIRTPNRGPSLARNRGIAEASGDWIAFLDADDEWHPQKTECQIAVTLSSADVVDLVASDWTRSFPDPLPDLPQPLPTTEISFVDTLVLNRFQTSTVLVRREVISRLNGFDDSVDGAEDWDMWLRIARGGRVVKVDWPLVRYRDVAQGYSKDVLRVYRTMQSMLDKHRDAGLDQRLFRRIETWHHLRFLVAFGLARNADDARTAWKTLVRRGLLRYCAGAARQYLLPFLWTRARRRART